MENKKCSICKEFKKIEDFNFQNKKQNKRVSACKNCSRDRQNKKRSENRELQRQKDRARYKKEREHRIKYAREYRINNKDKTRDTNLKVKYGIRQKDFEEMKEKQNNRCAICNKHQDELKRILCVDHCHSTGKVRGLLCDTCNKFLGFYEKLEKECKSYLLQYE